jgi:hypothetical protein
VREIYYCTDVPFICVHANRRIAMRSDLGANTDANGSVRKSAGALKLSKLE